VPGRESNQRPFNHESDAEPLHQHDNQVVAAVVVVVVVVAAVAVAVNGSSISELRGVTCHTGSHGVTCHQTQVNTPRLNPSQLDLPTLEGWKAEY